MKERLAIQLSVEKGEKKAIIDEYKKHGMSLAGRVLKLIREDVQGLKEK